MGWLSRWVGSPEGDVTAELIRVYAKSAREALDKAQEMLPAMRFSDGDIDKVLRSRKIGELWEFSVVMERSDDPSA